MGINKNNYEAYLLDLWEGNISEEDKVMLYQFLEKHPELNEEDALNLLGDISITENDTTFDKASVNFDQINLKNHEFFFVAYAEGDLSKEEMIEVDEFLIEHPTLNEKFAQFKKAKLPIETIQYPHKEKLVFAKAPILSIPNRRWIIAAVAASIALMLWISPPFQNVAYKYTMTPTGNMDLNKYTPDSLLDETEKQETNPIVTESENRFAVQHRFSPSKEEKEYKHNEIKDESSNQSTPSEQENHNSVPYHKEEFTAMEETEVNDLPNAVASNLPVEKIEEETIADNSPHAKEEIPTLLDLTASYLQRKNVLNNERKADLKGILNTTFSKMNNNNEPVLASSEESNMKTTVFQLGSLKVERKTTK